jgi:hypothetical protein
MIFYFIYKYVENKDPEHVRFVRVRRVNYISREDFVNTALNNKFNKNDEFNVEVPFSCIQRLTSNYNWHPYDKNLIQIEIPTQYKTYDEIMAYIFRKK